MRVLVVVAFVISGSLGCSGNPHSSPRRVAIDRPGLTSYCCGDVRTARDANRCSVSARNCNELVEIVPLRVPGVGALVFPVPSATRTDQLVLDRSLRQPEAFLGWEGRQTSFSYVRVDDRQTGDDREFFQRRSITQRIGTLSR
jgi:hypothetical protein